MLRRMRLAFAAQACTPLIRDGSAILGHQEKA
jgi:hypothetical protein